MMKSCREQLWLWPMMTWLQNSGKQLLLQTQIWRHWAMVFSGHLAMLQRILLACRLELIPWQKPLLRMAMLILKTLPLPLALMARLLTKQLVLTWMEQLSWRIIGQNWPFPRRTAVVRSWLVQPCSCSARPQIRWIWTMFRLMASRWLKIRR